jgi:hypothetical protein
MNKLMIAFAAATALMSFGCKKKGGASDAVAKMEEFQKKMCDCKDKACSDKVNEEMTKWGTEMAKGATGKTDEKPDPAIAKKSADIMTKYTECMTKNMMAGAGGGAAAGGGSAAAGGGGAVAGDGAGKCPDGQTYISKNNFCIKIPKGAREAFGGAKGRDGGNGAWEYTWMGGDKGWDYSLTVKVHPMKAESWDWNKEHVADPQYQGKKVAEGKIGDTGMWATSESGPPPAGFAQRHVIKSINKTEKEYLVCDITRANGKEAPTEEEVFEACKTIAFAK